MSPTPPPTALNELKHVPLYTPTDKISAGRDASDAHKEVIYNSMSSHPTDDDKSNKTIDVSPAVLTPEESNGEASLLPATQEAQEAPRLNNNALTQVNRSSRGVQNGDLLSAYLAEIRRYPLLDQSTETELAIRYKEHDDEDAGKTLVTSNLRLVVKMAFKYHSQWANVLDLIQQGNIGLLQALNKYDPYNPTKTRFSSYAAYWIRSCIYNYIKDNYRMVRLGSTRHGRKLFDNLRKVRENLLSQGITPTTKALSDAMEIPEEEIIVFSQHFSAPALSLDTPVNLDDKRSLEEVISSDHFPSPEEDVINTQITERIAEKIAEFGTRLQDPRDRAIWERRLLSDVPVSLKELGQDFNVSKERIRQIESRLKLQARAFLSQELGEAFLIDFSF